MLFLKYFRFNKILLQLSGVLPLESWGIFVNVVPIIIPFCTSGFLVLPAFYAIIFQGEDIEVTEALKIFSELLEILVSAFKVMLLLPKRRKLSNLVNLLNSLWKNVKDEELESVKHYVTRAMYLTYGFSINVFCALMSMLVQPAFTKFIFDSNGTMITSRQLPYASGLLHENMRIFNIWYLFQIPAGLVSMVLIVGVDTAVAFFVLHACAHFRLLQFRMFKLKHLKEESLGQNSRNNFKDIVKIVEQHKRVLQYSDAVEDVFSPVVLLQTILSITAICSFSFNLLMRTQDTMKYGLHLVGGILQLLMFCWPPNNLQTESMEIGMNAYDFSWHHWTLEERTLVKIIISRSQKVAFLSAGKFVHMSLQTFSSILSSAFSFFTLLRRVL